MNVLNLLSKNKVRHELENGKERNERMIAYEGVDLSRQIETLVMENKNLRNKVNELKLSETRLLNEMNECAAENMCLQEQMSNVKLDKFEYEMTKEENRRLQMELETIDSQSTNCDKTKNISEKQMREVAMELVREHTTKLKELVEEKMSKNDLVDLFSTLKKCLNTDEAATATNNSSSNFTDNSNIDKDSTSNQRPKSTNSFEQSISTRSDLLTFEDFGSPTEKKGGRGRPKGALNKKTIYMRLTQGDRMKMKRGRGRPKGALNKNTIFMKLLQGEKEKRGRGRPKGAVNKKTYEQKLQESLQEPREKRPRGRPFGSFKKKKLLINYTNDQVMIEEVNENKEKRKRGRPKGSFKKSYLNL